MMATKQPPLRVGLGSERRDGWTYLNESHVFIGLMLQNSLGLCGGDRYTWRIPCSSSVMRLSLRLVTAGGRHLGDPDDEDRGEEGALGDTDPGVGDPAQLRLKPRELELLAGLPPGVAALGTEHWSSRMRRSLRLFSRTPRPERTDGDDGAGGDVPIASSLCFY